MRNISREQISDLQLSIKNK